jgi:hypothetical protein
MVTLPGNVLYYEELRRAVVDMGAAIRARTVLQPAGGVGDKVFPRPTRAGSTTWVATCGEAGGQVVVLNSSGPRPIAWSRYCARSTSETRSGCHRSSATSLS